MIFGSDPENASRMIVADDGGAQISFDAGDNWSTYYNQPTAQFYRVSTDNHFPYRLLGAQQDNTTVRILSRTEGNDISQSDWTPTAGFESGYVVADPSNPDIVYGGNYGGFISRFDHKTGENRAVSVWPVYDLGSGADISKYRFQWNFPIFFSPHNPKKLYTAGNVLFATEDEGATWTALSGDLRQMIRAGKNRVAALLHRIIPGQKCTAPFLPQWNRLWKKIYYGRAVMTD